MESPISFLREGGVKRGKAPTLPPPLAGPEPVLVRFGNSSPSRLHFIFLALTFAPVFSTILLNFYLTGIFL